MQLLIACPRSLGPSLFALPSAQPATFPFPLSLLSALLSVSCVPIFAVSRPLSLALLFLLFSSLTFSCLHSPSLYPFLYRPSSFVSSPSLSLVCVFFFAVSRPLSFLFLFLPFSSFIFSCLVLLFSLVYTISHLLSLLSPSLCLLFYSL